jgi:outer membrane protein OmpA-like peptidoglycan-associated protein
MATLDVPRQYRVVGEETPPWVIFALALLGVLSSVATAYLLAGELQRQAWLPWTGDKGAKQVAGIVPPTHVGVDSEPIPALTDKVVKTPRATEVQPSVVEVPDCPPLFTVLFASESARPLATAALQEKIARLRDWLSGHPEVKLLVEGHTDLRGTEQFNLQLSSQRAEAVAALLSAAGVSREQLAARAYGKSKPLPGSRAESASNRRVSLRVEGFNECPKTSSEGDIP